MGYLLGLKEYLEEGYEHSIFDELFESQQLWEFQLHGHRTIRARVAENLTYDVKVDIEGQGEEELRKIDIKFLYPAEVAAAVGKLVKIDKKVKARGLEPLVSPKDRDFVKNKTLFPLMKDREVLFFTLLEGDSLRGLVAAFTRYEITLNLKGGIPVTILRHSIYDLRNKMGRCFMKLYQEKHRDWEKSDLFKVEDPTAQSSKVPG